METAYYFCLAAFYLMVVVVSYVTNKHANKGKLDKQHFLFMVLAAPICILIAFGFGRLFAGSAYKFALTIGTSAMLWLACTINPKISVKYEKKARDYGGLMVATVLAFLLG